MFIMRLLTSCPSHWVFRQRKEFIFHHQAWWCHDLHEYRVPSSLFLLEEQWWVWSSVCLCLSSLTSPWRMLDWGMMLKSVLIHLSLQASDVRNFNLQDSCTCSCHSLHWLYSASERRAFGGFRAQEIHTSLANRSFYFHLNQRAMKRNGC